MKRILIILSVFTMIFVVNSVDVSASYTYSSEPTGQMHILNAKYKWRSGGPDSTTHVYELVFYDPEGNVINMDQMFDSMDYFGDKSYLFLLPMDMDGVWQLTVPNDNDVFDGGAIRAIYVTFNGTATNSYMYGISDYNSASWLSVGADLIPVPLSEIDDTYIFTSYKYTKSIQESYNEGYLDGENAGDSIGYLRGRSEGYTEGQDDMYTDGSDFYGYTEGLSTDFQRGVLNLYNNGAVNQGLTLVDSFDYTTIYNLGETEGYDNGYSSGTTANLNTSGIVFMNNFNKWIVPAIMLVLLLGGAIGAVSLKNRRE